MNAHGKAAGAASMVSAIAAMLLAHSVAAEDQIIVYGERLDASAERNLAPPPIDSAEFLVALHDDLRASLREDLEAVLAQADNDKGAGRSVKVAATGTPRRG